MGNDECFFKGIFKKELREIMVFEAQKRKEIRPSTNYVELVAGRLAQCGLDVEYEYELTYSDGSVYRYDLWIKQYPHLVLDFDGEDSHSKEADKKKDDYTAITHRKDVLRIWNKQVEKELDLW
ncbi:hypothetical protein [Paenibacillus sp. FSL R5-0914]|uniref:hypothetical protein n=1 Tax=Paenibacillus sp. FSL R5-0914 TaxID=2921665 RepID=UPI0030F794E2